MGFILTVFVFLTGQDVKLESKYKKKKKTLSFYHMGWGSKFTPELILLKYLWNQEIYKSVPLFILNIL